jgi:hypothetical protein
MSVILGKADSIDPACEIQPSHRIVCRFRGVLLVCYTAIGIIFSPVEIGIASVICTLRICYYHIVVSCNYYEWGIFLYVE